MQILAVNSKSVVFLDNNGDYNVWYEYTRESFPLLLGPDENWDPDVELYELNC